MTVASYEENPCWEELPDFGEVVPDDYDDEDVHSEGTCDYCNAEPWRWPDGEPHTDPFGGRIVCRNCWLLIIGGDDE
jgi:hypothetical protein